YGEDGVLVEPVLAVLAGVARGPLHLPQERHQRAATPLGRVAVQDPPEQLLLVGEEGRDGLELDHLSPSPSTGSKLAMLMTMSAKRPPLLDTSSDCRFARLGALTFTL